MENAYVSFSLFYSFIYANTNYVSIGGLIVATHSGL